MATTPTRQRASRRRIEPVTLAAIVAIVALCAYLAPAAGAMTVAANYASAPLTYANGTNLQNCRGWGGDADDAGRFYTVCLFLRDLDGNGSGDSAAPALVEYTPAGRVERLGWMPPEYWFGQDAPANYVALDVGVAPDGNTAYVTTGPNIDNLGQQPNIHPYTRQPLPNGATSGAILRLTRQGDGSWHHDPTWKAGPFLIGGNWWAARRLDVDAAGRLYVTTNAIVHQLDPATGAVVSSFGGGATTDGPGGRWLEGIDKAQGIAVAADGSSVYVVDQQHQIVQRWLRTGPTDWQRDTGFLLGVPDEVGDYCATSTHFQSPYDVAVDAGGDIYVMDTTCNRVQRFTSTGAFVQTVWQDRTHDTLELSHGFAVNWQGSVVLPTAATVLTRLDPPARPAVAPGPRPGCADRLVPRITGIDAPVRSAARAVRLVPVVQDDCGITHVRVLGHRTGRARWIAATETTVTLSGWNGRRTLVVQVRDAGGRVASRRVTIELAVPQPPLRARTVVRIDGRGCRASNPMARVGNAASYRLVDRCARLSGRVTSLRASGRGISLELLVPASQARAIYANAVGPVTVWVVTDASSRRSGRGLRTGRTAIVVGSLVAKRDGTGVYAIPVDHLTGR